MYSQKQQLLDRDLVISNAQVLDSTSNIAGTTEINLGSANMGAGKPVKAVINVTALVGTLDIALCHKSAASVAVTDAPISLEQVSAVGQYHITLPQDCLQYVNLFYTAGTSAVITAWLTTDGAN